MLMLLGTNHWKEPSIMNVTTIGIDLAKSVFQLHGVDAAGEIVFRKNFAGPRCWIFCVISLPV